VSFLRFPSFSLRFCAVRSDSLESRVVCCASPKRESAFLAGNRRRRGIFTDKFTNGPDFSTRTFAESNSETSAKLNDVFIVNLLYCKNIDVKKEQNGAENHNQEPQSINLQRVSISSSGLDLLTLIPHPLTF
jgi:hypothetical protein